MLEEKPRTVFVIGAGASVEAGLPLGSKLKDEIRALYSPANFDVMKRGTYAPFVFDALAETSGYPERVEKAAKRLFTAMPTAISIDNLIDQLKDKHVTLCGKVAIVDRILNAERSSRMRGKEMVEGRARLMDEGPRERMTIVNQLVDTWYIPFFQRLTENCAVSDLRSLFKTVSLIIFNYDRCIEHFLYCALQTHYGIGGKKAAELVACFDILHPYGVVGALPWEKRGHDATVEYGGEPKSGVHLLGLAKGIKTFTEASSIDEGMLDAIRAAMSSGGRFIFLGFGFHELNMKLLEVFFHEFLLDEILIFATCCGISPYDQEQVALRLEYLFKEVVIDPDDEVRIRLGGREEGCAAFFHEYSRGLSFVL